MPPWVDAGAIFHIRIALDRCVDQRSLTTPLLAKSLIESADFYDRRQRWSITVFLLMPDHIHTLLSFQRDASMSRVIGDWKHFNSHKYGILWQEGYFDHRLRDDERGDQLSTKINYIRNNPVAAALCPRPEDWPWWIERSALDEARAR
ncbi:MAG TPA: transposase [Chthoniobacterales bacterium]|nr:transposase [Chthoniobacterales bacterium]